ncbi:hypothetical protein AGMMS49940_04740 [Spirochaetia bacterium]|nr:hypothetical protein AGMMS49940_04740 [Spirochaetia bacterium]
MKTTRKLNKVLLQVGMSVMILALELVSIGCVSTMWFEPPERHTVDKNYWREQAQQRILPAQNTFNDRLYASHDSAGNQVILDIVPGTKIYNIGDIFCEYAVSFRSVDMPNDIRQQLQRYRTVDGITYYDYVVSYVDRIVLSPRFFDNRNSGTSFSSNNVYPTDRVVIMNNSHFNVTNTGLFIAFLDVLVHETGHHHLNDLKKLGIVTASTYGTKGERFAHLQQMAFNEILLMNPDNYKNKFVLKERISRWSTRIAACNESLGLPVDNHEILPQSVYAPVPKNQATP